MSPGATATPASASTPAPMGERRSGARWSAGAPPAEQAVWSRRSRRPVAPGAVIFSRRTGCPHHAKQPRRSRNRSAPDAIVWHRGGSAIASGGAFARRLQARASPRCRSRREAVVSRARIQLLSSFVQHASLALDNRRPYLAANAVGSDSDEGRSGPPPSTPALRRPRERETSTQDGHASTSAGRRARDSFVLHAE